MFLFDQKEKSGAEGYGYYEQDQRYSAVPLKKGVPRIVESIETRVGCSRYTIQQCLLSVTIAEGIEQFVIDRQEDDSCYVRSEQPDGNGYGFVQKQHAGHSAKKNKGEENRYGGESRTEERGDHLFCPFHAGIFGRQSRSAVIGDRIGDDYTVVYHQSQCHDQPRQGNDIQCSAEEIQEEQAANQCDKHIDAYHRRGAKIPHEQERHCTDKEEADQQTAGQIGNRIVQQFRLVAIDVEYHIGMLRLQLTCQYRYGFA